MKRPPPADDPWASLPPEAKARAMDVRLPRDRRNLVIGVAITLALHAIVLYFVFFRGATPQAGEMLVFLRIVDARSAGPLPAHDARKVTPSPADNPPAAPPSSP